MLLILVSHLLSYLMSLFTILFFFFNDTATTEIYTLSLHDALPIYFRSAAGGEGSVNHLLTSTSTKTRASKSRPMRQDRKSTRLNSSHSSISYAVFCLKKKKKKKMKTNKKNKK